MALPGVCIAFVLFVIVNNLSVVNYEILSFRLASNKACIRLLQVVLLLKSRKKNVVLSSN